MVCVASQNLNVDGQHTLPISTKQTTTSHPNSSNSNIPTYDFGEPGPGLGQVQLCGGMKRLLGSHCLYTYWVMIFDSTQYAMIVHHNQAYNLSAGFLQSQITW